MEINFTAVIIAVAANFVFGFLWYTPLFGKAWGKEMGFDMNVKPKNSEMMRGMLLMIIGNFLMAWVLAHNIGAWSNEPDMMEASKTSNVMSTAFFTWLGFFLPVDLGVVAWEKKSWKLFFINTGYHLISLIVVAAILIYMG
jgi:hypothetical protein